MRLKQRCQYVKKFEIQVINDNDERVFTLGQFTLSIDKGFVEHVVVVVSQLEIIVVQPIPIHLNITGYLLIRRVPLFQPEMVRQIFFDSPRHPFIGSPFSLRLFRTSWLDEVREHCQFRWDSFLKRAEFCLDSGNEFLSDGNGKGMKHLLD